MFRLLRVLAVPALLLAAPALAGATPGCAVVEWSDAHGHYHCAAGPYAAPPYREVRYYDPRPVSGPRIHVDLSLGHYPHGWRRYGSHWGWYHPVPRFYAPPPRHYHRHHYHHGFR